MEDKDKVMVSTTIDKEIYEKIKEMGLKLNSIIYIGINYIEHKKEFEDFIANKIKYLESCISFLMKEFRFLKDEVMAIKEQIKKLIEKQI